MDIPLNYRLDCDGLLIESLAEDTPSVIMETGGAFRSTRYSKVIIAAADLLVSESVSRIETYKHSAFYNGGTMAFAAFMESDAPKALRDRTLASLSLRQVPLTLLSTQKILQTPLTGWP